MADCGILIPTASMGCASLSFDASGLGSTLTSSYRWTYNTPSPNSALTGASFPFADNGADSEVVGNAFEMTGNVGLWHFDGNASGSSGLAHHGTLSGPPTILEPGRVGSAAYNFEASSFESISIGVDVGDIIHNYPFSLCFWSRCTDTPSGDREHVMVGNASDDSWSDGWGTYWSGSSTVRFWVNDYQAAGGFTAANWCDVTGLNPLIWNHFSFTYNGVSMVAYVNGEREVGSICVADVTGLTNNLLFGKMPGDPTDKYFNGDLDEIALFNYELTEQQVEDIYFLQSGSCAYGDGTDPVPHAGIYQGLGPDFKIDENAINDGGTYILDLFVTGAGGTITCTAPGLGLETYIDCAGTECGTAEEDCLGVCNGDAIVGCDGVCLPEAEAAFVNECGFCVGGTTGLPVDYCCRPRFESDFTMNTFWNSMRGRKRNALLGPFIMGTRTVEAINTNIGTGSYAITGTC